MNLQMNAFTLHYNNECILLCVIYYVSREKTSLVLGIPIPVQGIGGYPLPVLRPHVRHLEQVGMHTLQARVGARHPPVKEVVSPLVGGRERALELSAAIAKHAVRALWSDPSSR